MDRKAESIKGNPARLTSGPGKERVLCLDAATGKQIWAHEYDCTYQRISYGFGPRATPIVVGDRVYTLGTMGDLQCLDAKNGKPIWTVNFAKDLKAKTPVWEWSSNPLVPERRQDHLPGWRRKAGSRRLRSQQRQGALARVDDDRGRLFSANYC